MKKTVILLILVLVFTGCSKKIKEENIEIVEPIKIIEEEKYVDENNTQIGLYLDKGNRLQLIDEYKTNLISGNDIEIFSVYPSNAAEIILNGSFGNAFYNTCFI